MSKLIIDNRADLSDIDALEMVNLVIKQGRISNEGKQYCYGTGYSLGDKHYMVWTDLNKKSDRFIITDKKVKTI